MPALSASPRMKTSAVKSEIKGLRWFISTGVGQTESCAKPVEGANNRPQFIRQMPAPPYGVNNRLDLDAERYQYRKEGILPWVYPLK